MKTSLISCSHRADIDESKTFYLCGSQNLSTSYIYSIAKLSTWEFGYNVGKNPCIGFLTQEARAIMEGILEKMEISGTSFLYHDSKLEALLYPRGKFRD